MMSWVWAGGPAHMHLQFSPPKFLIMQTAQYINFLVFPNQKAAKAKRMPHVTGGIEKKVKYYGRPIDKPNLKPNS
jgi:hypothetical protein